MNFKKRFWLVLDRPVWAPVGKDPLCPVGEVPLCSGRLVQDYKVMLAMLA